MAYSIGSDGAALIGGTGAGERLRRWPGTTRRGVQVVLGVLWLLDGALQLQPFMFTTDFAQRVLAPSGQHQPAWVAAPTDFSAGIIAGHPAPLNVGFALLEVALGVGFLVPRLVRPAIVVSVAFVVATTFWVLGENIGQLYSDQATDPNTGPLIVLMALALVGLPRRGESSSRTHLLVGRVRHDVA